MHTSGPMLVIQAAASLPLKPAQDLDMEINSG